jgi:hypothetical protein
VEASISAIAGGIASGLVGGALAVIFAGRVERRKAMGKYAHKQRAELDALIGRYQDVCSRPPSTGSGGCGSYRIPVIEYS